MTTSPAEANQLRREAARAASSNPLLELRLLDDANRVEHAIDMKRKAAAILAGIDAAPDGHPRHRATHDDDNR